ncbi:MAG TPA: carotenoid oxygenase family protein [Acidimicrobiales bacterium]|nr:carotenoid oxygenase family protein [Acidimicrobiales bacterium]
MTTTSPYLTGNFAPVTEELTAVDLAVTGKLPEELDGRYLRNGPNPVTPPEPSRYHWFTGDGMVHGIRLRGGRAEWYRNRWVRSAAVAEAMGEAPRPGPVHAGMDFAANTNVIGHAGRTWAIVEGGARPYELTHELETVGPSDFGGTLPGGYTAHPKRDPLTGELHAISYFWGWGDKVQYTVVDTEGRVRRVVDVEVGGPVSVHDMSLTSTYAVIYDLPVVFNVEAAAAGANFPYRWDPDYRSRVGLLPREGAAGDVAWFDVEPCYVFHPLNAYDDGDRVVLDVVRHPRMFATHLNGPDEGTPTLDRWTVDTKAGKVIEERLDDRGQEFPRVDERVVGLPHRYGYAAGTASSGGGFRADAALLKHDLRRGTCEVRSLGDGNGSAEPVFVPRRPDSAEDDGWVLSLVYDAGRQASDLLVVNAADFTGEPQAVVHLPARVPFGFHGNWVPES